MNQIWLLNLHIKRGIEKKEMSIINTQFIIDLFYLLSLCLFTSVLIWISERYNRPLMTRRDLVSGKEVSMLMFIRSKYNMR